MVFTSFREALGLLKSLPVIWLSGIIWGIFFALSLLLTFSENSFFFERIGLLLLITIPFFVGGTYNAIKHGNGNIPFFTQAGFTYFFPVLLPTIIIFLAWLLVVFLVIVTLNLLGITPDPSSIFVLMFGAFLPIEFFTFFYDTAAVFEDQKIFESIRRSVELVLTKSIPCVLFFIVVILIFVVIYIATNVAWLILLPEQLEPLFQMSQSELQSMNPEEWKNLIGEGGLWITAGILMIASTIFFSIFYAFKATFFRRYSAFEKTPVKVGEYDEKGRWYKY
jgi:hypothetical protein